RLRWTATPAARLCELAGLLWLAALAGDSALPAAFALLAAIAYRGYDLLYRVRQRGVTPAPWVNALALGWDGRLVLGFILLAAGALPAGFYLWAAIAGAAFVGESAAAWLPGGHDPGGYDQEDDE
ncbi:MAG: DUF5941 domain-containing protein, partial [Solirubrobacteraceae bacterium]